MAGPAAAAAGALSGTEKEKLREKLALLRREYSETVRRLRRARRAERARSHGLGTAAEGDRRERCPAGSKDNISPSADEHESSQLQTETCSGLDREKKTSVPSKPLLKLPSNEVILQDSSQASQENLCCGVLSPVSEEKKAQTSRGLMKLRRRTKALVPEQKAAACEVHPVSTDETVTNQIATMEGLQSPVFIRSRPLNIEENSPRALMQREENGFTSSDAAVRDTREDSVPQGVPELFPCVQGDSSHVWQPESPSMVAPCDSHEPVWLSSENGNAVFLETSGNGGEESLSIIKQTAGESLHEDQGELQRLLDFVSENEVLPADGSSTVIDESKSLERHHRDTNSLKSFHTDLALGNVEGPLETQQLGVQSQLSHPEKVVAPESALTSCTVVEGLLFPVEYYVRTTRRMSSCQRKVDLDAVILSQLGRSKKGQRTKCRQKDANSSQERAENDLELGVALFPFLGAENDPATSSTSQKSLPASSGSSTSLGSISQTSITSRKRGQRRSQGKQKGRRKSACKCPGHQVSQELVQGLPFLAPGEGSSLLINKCQSEKENCKANLEKSSLDDRCLSGAAASGSGEEGAGTVPPTATDPPGGSHALGKCCKTLLEKLQNSPSLGPGNETSASHSKDLEANIAAAPQADNQPAEQARNRCGWGARSAEQLLVTHPPLCHSPRCWAGRGAGQVPKDESSRGHSYLVSPDGPASLDLPAVDSETCNSLFSFRCLQWLAPTLGVREFDLPDEEFGQLKFEKLESSPMNDLEVFVPSVFGDDVTSEDTQDAQINPEEKTLKSNLPSLFNNGSPKLPHIEGPASKRDLSTHELLFTPVGTVLAGAPTQPESEMSSSVFPVVGATPAVSPAVRSELFPSSPSAPPLQARSPSSKAASAQAMGDGECKDSDILLHLDSSGLVSARKGEEQGAAFLLEAERGPDNKSDESVSLEKHQQSESEQQRSCRASSEQKKDAAGQLAPGLLDGLLEENLQLVSKLKSQVKLAWPLYPCCLTCGSWSLLSPLQALINPVRRRLEMEPQHWQIQDSSGSCSVDVSTMWWEAAGCRELCVVTAEESSVSLWKPLASDRWGKVHTWQLGEIPVIQIIPLPDTCNLVCIALGDLEIGEIRLLLYSSENDSFNQSLMKTGTIKAVLGLKDRRLVSSSRTVQEQQVEIVSLSETGGSKDGQTLMPPEETVLAFAEVEGMREALVGATAVNSIVVWNLKTGQLLKKMHVGYSYPASICHRAYSDLGLLFVVLSHPHAKESESCGNPAFRVVAFNPKTARSTGVMFSSLPPAHAGRYLEGDVKDTSAAAVLTSGAIAVWDLLLGRCTALLPPSPGGSWALVRWATTSACLLAGQQDGTVCLYQYHQPQTSAA